MYGSANTDPVVKYYDASLALGSDEEIAWYLNKARRFGGPVLDLACGTGRLTLLLAREGFAVTGLDQSEGMLHHFEQKLRIEHAQDGHLIDQTITTTMRFTRYDAEGNETEQSESWWKSRYLFRYEAIHLLHRCGLNVEALVGD